MKEVWANDFYEILPTLSVRKDLLVEMIELIKVENIPGKSLEGSGRLDRFKEIIIDLINQRITLHKACMEVENRLGRNGSPYANNNRVFATDWGERLVRTQLSRFYNQTVLLHLLNNGDDKCFIPHSNSEDSTSKCSLSLAGKQYSVKLLLDSIIESYSNGNFQNSNPRLPDHPHCTHVVRAII